MLDRRRYLSPVMFFFLGSRTAPNGDICLSSFLSLDNATLAGKRSTLYISDYTGIIIHLPCGSATSLKLKYTSIYTRMYMHVGRDRRLPRSKPEISNRLSLKRSITGWERRGRKIDDGVRKGMPLRRLAAAY